MNDDLVQAYARLSVHEFAIEVMMANWIATMTEQQADEFLSEYQNRTRSTWSAGETTADDEALNQMLRDSRQLHDNLLNKVKERASQIREGLNQQ